MAKLLPEKMAQMNNDSEIQRKRGRKSREFENIIAERLKLENDYVFLPYEVCDRICIKDGSLFFVEIKQPKRVSGRGYEYFPLTEKQLLFRRLVGSDLYKIISY